MKSTATDGDALEKVPFAVTLTWAEWLAVVTSIQDQITEGPGKLDPDAVRGMNAIDDACAQFEHRLYEGRGMTIHDDLRRRFARAQRRDARRKIVGSRLGGRTTTKGMSSATRLLHRDARRRGLRRALLADAAHLDRKAARVARDGEIALLPGVAAEFQARAVLLRAQATDLRARTEDIIDDLIERLNEDSE